MNRREFLKISTLGAVAAIVPITGLPALLKEKSQPESWVQFHCSEQPAGEYLFSYFHRITGGSLTIRFVQAVHLEEPMSPYCVVELRPGEEISSPMLERVGQCANNMYSNSTPPTLHNAVRMPSTAWPFDDIFKADVLSF